VLSKSWERHLVLYYLGYILLDDVGDVLPPSVLRSSPGGGGSSRCAQRNWHVACEGNALPLEPGGGGGII